MDLASYARWWYEHLGPSVRLGAMSKRLDPIHRVVGNNIRIFQLAKGFSQQDLAKLLGVTYQQLQKYEYGTNGVGAGRLARLSKLLDTPISRFFENTLEPSGQNADSVTELLINPYAIRMLRALSRISDGETIVSIVMLAETITEVRR